MNFKANLLFISFLLISCFGYSQKKDFSIIERAWLAASIGYYETYTSFSMEQNGKIDLHIFCYPDSTDELYNNIYLRGEKSKLIANFIYGYAVRDSSEKVNAINIHWKDQNDSLLSYIFPVTRKRNNKGFYRPDFRESVNVLIGLSQLPASFSITKSIRNHSYVNIKFQVNSSDARYDNVKVLMAYFQTFAIVLYDMAARWEKNLYAGIYATFVNKDGKNIEEFTHLFSQPLFTDMYKTNFYELLSIKNFKK